MLIVPVALAIVAYLARDALVSAFGSLTRTTAAGDARLPAAASAASNGSAATPTMETSIDRARAVEDVMRKQQEQTGRRIDAAR